MRPPAILSVIVTTYNNPRGLRLVLTGLARQTFQDFDLLIADDGSGPETAAIIAEFTTRAPFPVRHLWHPDQGFRKCATSNKAILEAAGDYLIFFDGDCIPPSHCLATHLGAAQGVRGRSVRYTAPVFHLEHARPYTDPVQLARNRALYDENRAQRLVWTPHCLPAP